MHVINFLSEGDAKQAGPRHGKGTQCLVSSQGTMVTCIT